MISCFFENNKEARLRHAVVDGLVIKGNKILLIKRAAKVLTNPSRYALPGGFLDRDENIKQGVLREVLEETGYKSKIVSLFQIIDKPKRKNDDRQNVAFVYILKALKKVSRFDRDEIANTFWFDLNELPSAKEFGFDHLDTIRLYLKHRKKPLKLPIITS